uniref:Homer protein homolog 2-like n=1 Tax=Sinocyclocheilus rhinocerous TaxID=307959 RepID=A0A673J471_9TELE
MITELQALMDSNARLTDTLQEANSNAESWKSKVTQNTHSHTHSHTHTHTHTHTLACTCRVLLSRLHSHTFDGVFQELEDLRKQAETIPQLMAKCESVTAKLQAAETASRDQSEKMTLLQSEIDDSQHKQKNMKTELKKFMDVLDGKIDELHEVRQGFSKLGVDN